MWRRDGEKNSCSGWNKGQDREQPDLYLECNILSWKDVGERNAIKQWYSLLKSGLKILWKHLPLNASNESAESWVTAIVVLYNLRDGNFLTVPITSS